MWGGGEATVQNPIQQSFPKISLWAVAATNFEFDVEVYIVVGDLRYQAFLQDTCKSESCRLLMESRMQNRKKPTKTQALVVEVVPLTRRNVVEDPLQDKESSYKERRRSPLYVASARGFADTVPWPYWFRITIVRLGACLDWGSCFGVLAV